MAAEKIEIKTTNGTAKVTRTDKVATIEEERTCFGFNEKSKTVVTKLNDDCLHFAFGKKADVIATLKNN